MVDVSFQLQEVKDDTHESTVDRLPRGRAQRPAIITYLSDPDDSRMLRTLAQQSTLPNSDRNRRGNNDRPPRTDTGTSLLVGGTELTSTHDLAALTTSMRTAATESEPSSFGARQLDISNSRLLAEAEGGVLVVDRASAQGNLECPFNLLFCLKTFSNIEDWVKHSVTHFGEVGPPESNRCCFCEAKFNSSSDVHSWAKRMNHIAFHHQLSCRLAHARPDFELYTYMWNKRLIDDAEYRDIKGNHQNRSQAVRAYPSPPESPEEQPKVYTDTFSNSRNHRGRER